MGNMTDRFYRELRRSHTVVTYINVIAPDLESVRLKVVDGEVACDRTAQVRRSITVQAVDPEGELTPRAVGEILTPYGTEIRPFRGVRYDDGTEEVAPMGVFRISTCTITEGIQGTANITIEAYDRSRTVSRDKFIVPYTVAAGTNCLTAIREIISRTFPDAEYDSITTTLTTTGPRLYDSGADPWEAVTELARSMGCEIYFDVEGRVAIVPPPDINALPAEEFQYIEGQGCTMLELTRLFTDEPGFNGVIVTGESPGDEEPPVRGEAWDVSPSSPTYRYGPYGEVPAFITDSVVKTQEECEAIAKAQLALALGFSSQLTVTAITNPSFEAGHTVRVKRIKSGIDGLYVLDAFTVPLLLSNAQQVLTLRERRAI